MRPVCIVGTLIAFAGCGFDLRSSEVPDASEIDALDVDAPTKAPPRLIPGGGIADAPIQGALNVYVVDDLTNRPIAGAAIDVGGIAGVTDATGLFVATAPTLMGKQTVVATMTGYRAAMWIGIAGANVTIPLEAAPLPPVPRGSLAGTIVGTVTPAPLANHSRIATVAYSSSDLALSEENEIRTSTSRCALPTCPFTVTTRTGSLALFAGIYDIDSKGTGTTNDDTSTLITWAYKTGITVMDGMSQSGLALTVLAPGQLADVTVDFGTPPAGLPGVIALPALELGVDGVATLFQIAVPTVPTIRIPSLTTFPGATYRLTAAAADSFNFDGALSIVIRRGITGASFVTGTWMTPPTMVTASRAAVSWTGASGATIHTVEYRQGTLGLLSIYTFDGTTTATLPTSLALPTMPIQASVGAIRSTYDVASFGFEANVNDVDGLASAAPVTIN